MWAEQALDAWSALERDAITGSGGSPRVLDGPHGRRAPLWPIAHVLWAAAEVRTIGGSPPIDHLRRALEPYRSGDAYAAAPRDRRYFDDNAWLGLAMLRMATVVASEPAGGEAAELARFVQQGEHPDGGVRWAEGSESRNTCSTASAAWLVLAAQPTDESETAARWMRWLDETLLGEDGLYGDRIENGSIDSRRWTYNQGAALAARRALGLPAAELRDAILESWPADRLWQEPPAFAAIAYRALREERDAWDRIDAIWDPHLKRLLSDARNPETGWYSEAGLGSYDGRPTIDQAAVVQMLALRSAG